MKSSRCSLRMFHALGKKRSWRIGYVMHFSSNKGRIVWIFFPAKFRVSSGEFLQFHPDVLLKKSCTSEYVISPIIYKVLAPSEVVGLGISEPSRCMIWRNPAIQGTLGITHKYPLYKAYIGISHTWMSQEINTWLGSVGYNPVVTQL